jgi:tetratricopeptide (TPR) repeat protein
MLSEDNESAYGVAWRCPQCQDRSLDICPIGPLIPTTETCLNCGGLIPSRDADAICVACGLSQSAAEESLHVTSLPPDMRECAAAAFGEGRFRFGIAAANKALIENPQLEQAWALKTNVLASLGFQRSLITVLGHMLDIGIRSTALSLGSLLFDRGQYADAIEVYRDFLAKYPEDELVPAVMGNLANAVSASGNRAEAEQLYLASIEREPMQATHYINYAFLLRQEGRGDEALGQIAAGLGVAVETASQIRLLEDGTYLHCEKDQGGPALQYIERALALGAKGIRARYLHGRALALVGRLPEARNEMLSVLSADPSNADAKRGLEMIDRVLGRGGGWFGKLFG